MLEDNASESHACQFFSETKMGQKNRPRGKWGNGFWAMPKGIAPFILEVNETRFSNSFIEKRVSSCLQSLEKPRLFFFIC